MYFSMRTNMILDLCLLKKDLDHVSSIRFFFVSFFFHFIECVCCVGCCSCIFLIFQLKLKKFAIKYQKYCCSFYCFICVRSQLFFICLNMFENYTNFDMKNKNKSIRIQNCKMYNNKRIKTETPTTHFVGIA